MSYEASEQGNGNAAPSHSSDETQSSLALPMFPTLDADEDDEVVSIPPAKADPGLPLASARPPEPVDQQRVAADEAILAKVGIEVLGHWSKTDRIEIYSKYLGEVRTMPRPEDWTYLRAVQKVGLPIALHVSRDNDAAEGKIPIEDLKDTVARNSGKRCLDGTLRCGDGIWRVGRERTIVVSGNRAMECLAGKLTDLPSPLVEGALLDLTSRDAWADREALAANLVKARDPEWAMQRLDAAQKLFEDGWQWTGKYDARTIALLVAATYIQTLWPWRPTVAITGPTYSGKTLLLKTLKRMFGELTLLMYRATSDEFRQSIQNRLCNPNRRLRE
jgi:hypothetical protein